MLLAFVNWSLVIYYQVQKEIRASSYNKKPHHFLLENCKPESWWILWVAPCPTPTKFAEQNHIMHSRRLYCGFNANASKDSDFIKNLCRSFLSCVSFSTSYQQRPPKTLRWIFSSDWHLHPETGNQVEPGQHFEWVWCFNEPIKYYPTSDYNRVTQQLNG